jgi:hypothetical protein
MPPAPIRQMLTEGKAPQLARCMVYSERDKNKGFRSFFGFE